MAQPSMPDEKPPPAPAPAGRAVGAAAAATTVVAAAAAAAVVGSRRTTLPPSTLHPWPTPTVVFRSGDSVFAGEDHPGAGNRGSGGGGSGGSGGSGGNSGGGESWELLQSGMQEMGHTAYDTLQELADQILTSHRIEPAEMTLEQVVEGLRRLLRGLEFGSAGSAEAEAEEGGSGVGDAAAFVGSRFSRAEVTDTAQRLLEQAGIEPAPTAAVSPIFTEGKMFVGPVRGACVWWKGCDSSMFPIT